MSEAPASFAFEQLEPSAALAPDDPERIVAQARAEAERIRGLAHTEGYERGFAGGHGDGLAETRQAALALGEALAGIERSREQLTRSLEQDALDMTLALAAKIVAGALEVQPERVIDVVAGALRRISERRTTTVLVNPADLEIVSSAIGELSVRVGGIELCDVQSDRRVGRGGAIVRTPEGEVDACIATQLERAREVTLEALGAPDDRERTE